MEPVCLIEWRKDYESGIEEIDEQHKNIINTLNEIYLAFCEGENAEAQICRLIDGFDFYMTTHIETEEKYAEQYNFPKITELKESHDFIKATYKQLKYLYRSKKEYNPSFKYILHLHSVMREWLVFHLDTLDKELLDFLKNQNI